MLLSEIAREPKQPIQTELPYLKPSRFKQIGTGSGGGGGFDDMPSKIYLDLKFPNNVMKVVPIKSLRDPYYRFLRMIEYHQHNPFFPKVKSVKIYQYEGYFDYADASHDSLILYAYMEKLVPLHDLPEAVARNLLQAVGIDYPRPHKLKNDWTLQKLFDEPSYRQHLRDVTKVKWFKQALRLLEPMIRKFGNDLHIENLMARKTTTGYELVIIDPFFPDFGDLDQARYYDF